jgi:uncharacterized repeat protein (TIGR04138 family)
MGPDEMRRRSAAGLPTCWTAPDDVDLAARVAAEITELCEAFPLYPEYGREHAHAPHDGPGRQPTETMDERLFEALRERNPRYDEAAYLFVLAALNHVLRRLPEPRHISGRELAEGVRDLALARFGPMARSVLEHWGIHETTDVGEIVFALVEHGVLIKQDEDTRADFADVFDFAEAFEPQYPRRAQG